MGNDHINKLLCYNQDILSELYVIESIVKVTSDACMEREFSGQYYGTTGNNSALLSAERNGYINILRVLAEKIETLINLNIVVEDELLLQQNTNYCCGKIAAESSANQCS